MNVNTRLIIVSALLIFTLSACALFNPFVGKWKAGLLELEFKSDKTFKLVIGSAISINLEGTYSYDSETLTLDIEGDSKVPFTYSFKDGKKTLVLVPESEFEYIKSEIELQKQ